MIIRKLASYLLIIKMVEKCLKLMKQIHSNFQRNGNLEKTGIPMARNLKFIMTSSLINVEKLCQTVSNEMEQLVLRMSYMIES